MKGVIVRLVKDRGFGFIRADSGSEHFFHRSGLAPHIDFAFLDVGTPIVFDLEKDPKNHARDRATRIEFA